jgi:hypothetical protein
MKGRSRYTAYTVNKIDGKVRHPEWMTQDRFIRVSNKDLYIPVDNFTRNIELFRQTFTCVELLRYKHIPNDAILR